MKYTPEEYAKEVERRINQLRKADLIYPVATKVHADMSERIFDNGINGDGNKIGEYSTEPAYYSKKQFKKTSAFKPRGKHSNDLKLKDGRPRKSMFIADGYHGLKGVQGYKNDTVNLTYSSTLRNNFDAGLTEDEGKVIVRLNAANADKMGWMVNKYGKATFKHTKEGKQFFRDEITKRLIKVRNGSDSDKIS